MSLIRKCVLLGIIVMLLPTDERRQTEVSSMAGAALERTLTFCERNPGTCAAGSELWATFVRKAEFGLELATRAVRDGMSHAASRRDVSDQPGAHRRIEPAGQKGTLTPSDMQPQWRGVSLR